MKRAVKRRDSLEWTNVRVKLGQLVPWADNPRVSSKKQAERILKSFDEFGQVQTIAVDPEMNVLDGHQRLSALLTVYGKDYEVDVRQSSRSLTDEERRRLVVMLHAGATGSWDWDMLSAWDDTLLQSAGIDEDMLRQINRDAAAVAEMLRAADGGASDVDAEPQIDRAEELREKWQTARGQVWRLGEHRLMCGDSTRAEDVARLMGSEKAALCHADPPYGMGKEKDGIANDNLYRDKLDAFHMQWWKACRPRLSDNASVYIWGNAEDLWRLWYVGGLKDSERLTLRNEIVWNKNNGQGMGSDEYRMYPTATERALFFMLGEQEFSRNADNYWDGWEPVRLALAKDCEKMGWGAKDIERICGVGMYSHWFTKSQWQFIPKEHYDKLKAAAQEHDAFKREYDAFKREYDELKREYDELKREFYSTRAYFDNTHDNMTDVWSFERVIGDERHGHATPKPVAMVARAIKSSTPKDGVVYAPFSGTGPEIVACEQLCRKCRALEISEAYTAVALERWHQATGSVPVLLESA